MLRVARRLTSAGLALGMLLATAPASLADVLAGSEDDAFVIGGSSPGAPGGSPNSRPEPAPILEGVSQPEEVPPPGSWEPLWGVAPDTGERCVDLVYRPNVPPDSPLALEWEFRTLEMVDEARADGSAQGLCRPEDVLVQPTPALAANEFVRRIPLPEPQPQIAPGFALTGLPAYLVIDGQVSFSVDEDLAGWGPMQVTLEPVRFVVDWGDGTVQTITDGRTGAAHDGDPAQQIAHTYRWSEPESGVTVRADWQARWQVGGFSGTVDGLVVEAVLELPVREYRSVRADG